MRSLSCFILSLCKTLLNNLHATAEGFTHPETGDYDLFATNIDFNDPLAQSEFLPSDPLAQNDISLFADPLSFNDGSTSLLSSSDLFANPPTDDCTSDITQDQFVGKRLDTASAERPQLCLPQRSNPGKYPGFDPQNDPLIPINIKDPEDEEFCPRQLYFPSYLVCDSGYFVDRKLNRVTGLYNLNRCQRSTVLAYPSSLFLFALGFC